MDGSQQPIPSSGVVANTSEEAIFANMESAMKRGLPFLGQSPAHDGVAIIVGSGPSLASSFSEISFAAHYTGKVFALNGAASWLDDHGIRYAAQIMVDARESNVRFIDQRADWYRPDMYLASQCHPAVFDRCTGRPVTAWHVNYDGRAPVPMEHNTYHFGGSTSVGGFAMQIVEALGYRTIHMYGVDCSYADGKSHAVSMPENEEHAVGKVSANGREFFTTPWMVEAVNDFQRISNEQIARGIKIFVHGDGLLPYVAVNRGRDIQPLTSLAPSEEQKSFMRDCMSWIIQPGIPQGNETGVLHAA